MHEVHGPALVRPLRGSTNLAGRRGTPPSPTWLQLQSLREIEGSHFLQVIAQPVAAQQHMQTTHPVARAEAASSCRRRRIGASAGFTDRYRMTDRLIASATQARRSETL